MRTRDAPVFGTDVSLQKARTAAFLSSSAAAAFLAALPDAKYLTTSDTAVGVTRAIVIGDYVTALRTFLGDRSALADGAIAYHGSRGSATWRGRSSRTASTAQAPGRSASRRGEWSPFSTGLQLDLAINAILQHVLFVAGAGVPDVAPGCAGVALANDLSSVGQTIAGVRLGNGLQIFPGSVPIYRGSTLVGAHRRVRRRRRSGRHDRVPRPAQRRRSRSAATIGNAPADRRADTVIAAGRAAALRAVSAGAVPRQHRRQRVRGEVT